METITTIGVLVLTLIHALIAACAVHALKTRRLG